MIIQLLTAIQNKDVSFIHSHTLTESSIIISQHKTFTASTICERRHNFKCYLHTKKLGK